MLVQIKSYDVKGSYSAFVETKNVSTVRGWRDTRLPGVKWIVNMIDGVRPLYTDDAGLEALRGGKK